MAVYCISYTLKSGNYDKLHDAIRNYGLWWHQSESVWFIETNQSSKQIHENLRNFISSGDKLLVIQLQKNWWGIGYTQDEFDWLKNRNF